MKAVIAFLLVMVIAVPVLAGAPVNGTYKSTDIGGVMLPGRYSESWFPTRLVVNNTLNEQSWDGATLGTEWHWYCPWIVVPPTLLSNTVNGAGNGSKSWFVRYTGGICWLNGAGPWAGGDASYTANINTWTAIVTETYSNFVAVTSVRTHSASASFNSYTQQCMALTISNTARVGDTDSGTLPANYPNFWDWTTCSDIGTAGPGEWGNVHSITFTVQGCETVSTEQRSWGAVKSLYRK
jgi:hypothetical protein